MALKGKPRPHYLIGEAEYSLNNGIYKLISRVIFPSTRDSIEDRNKPPIPHANIGDAYFGVWNAVHLICDQIGVYGTLTNQGGFIAKKPLPPDKPIELEVLLMDTHNNDRHIQAEYNGTYMLEGKVLLKIFGRGIGRKIKEA